MEPDSDADSDVTLILGGGPAPVAVRPQPVANLTDVQALATDMSQVVE